jgi:hypothetical protein
MISTLAQALLPTFVVPGLAIAGAAAMSVPIVIHILSRRPRKPEPWAAMKFLLAAYRKHRVRTRMEQWLLLATRCLLLLLLGAALAGPIWSALGSLAGISPRGRTMVVVVDNSVTSGARAGSASATRLEGLKATAMKIIDGLGPGDRVAVITAARPAAALISPPTADPAGARRMIEQLTAAESASDIAGALRLAQSSLDQMTEAPGDVYVALLSDFSAGAIPAEAGAALPQELARLGERGTLLMTEPAEALANVQIASLEPDRRLITPGGAGEAPTITWTAKVRRFTGAPRGGEQTTFRLDIPQVAGASHRQAIPWAEGQTEAELRVTTALSNLPEESKSALLTATATIEPPADGSDALTVDNERRMTVRLRPRLTVLLLDRTLEETAGRSLSPRRWLSIALAPVADRLGWPIDVKTADAGTLDAAGVRTADAVFVLRGDLLDEAGWEALRSHVTGGAMAWFMAPAQDTPSIWPQKMADVFGLPWSITLEPARHAPPLRLALDQPAAGELSRLRADLPDLIKPVEFVRRLPVDAASLGSRTDLLLRGEGGGPLLMASNAGEGRVLFLASALDVEWTNLTIKPLFVPLIHEALSAAIDRLQPRRDFEPGDQPALGGAMRGATKLIGPGDRDLLLVALAPEPGAAGASTVIQPIRPLEATGVYRTEADALTVNVRAEACNTQAGEPGALRAWLAGAGNWRTIRAADPLAELRSEDRGGDWGWHVLWAVLALAVVETYLARWVSHAQAAGRAVDATTIGAAS